VTIGSRSKAIYAYVNVTEGVIDLIGEALQSWAPVG